jgi:hypothetical protein
MSTRLCEENNYGLDSIHSLDMISARSQETPVAADQQDTNIEYNHVVLCHRALGH